jgi:hypothetical protein
MGDIELYIKARVTAVGFDFHIFPSGCSLDLYTDTT